MPWVSDTLLSTTMNMQMQFAQTGYFGDVIAEWLKLFFLVQVRLRQKYYTPQNRLDLVLNTCPPDHGQ